MGGGAAETKNAPIETQAKPKGTGNILSALDDLEDW